MSSTDNIILVSSDGESFEVEEAVALESRTIFRMIEVKGIPDGGIPLPNVTGKILSKVIEYCKKHVDEADRASSVAGDDHKAWDAEFVKVDEPTLYGLIMAAKDLDIEGLLHLTCRTVADMIKGKTPDEIRKTFGLKSDLTPEQEEEMRRENPWAFVKTSTWSKPAFLLWLWSFFTRGN